MSYPEEGDFKDWQRTKWSTGVAGAYVAATECQQVIRVLVRHLSYVISKDCKVILDIFKTYI